MKHIKKFESFSSIRKIDNIKIGDVIIYQGSKCEVMEKNDFIINVRSIKTGKEFTINQSQLQENGATLFVDLK